MQLAPLVVGTSWAGGLRCRGEHDIPWLFSLPLGFWVLFLGFFPLFGVTGLGWEAAWPGPGEHAGHAAHMGSSMVEMASRSDATLLFAGFPGGNLDAAGR